MTLSVVVWAVLAQSQVAAVQRTPPASKPAARVVALSGAASASTGKREPIKPLTQGTDLDAADVLTVGPGAWAAVALLGNGHVVRVDDDLSITISQLALFTASPTRATVGAQLERLLTPAERASTNSERLIGWHAGLSAANTPKAKGASRASPDDRAEDALATSPRAAPAPAPAPPSPSSEKDVVLDGSPRRIESEAEVRAAPERTGARPPRSPSTSSEAPARERLSAAAEPAPAVVSLVVDEQLTRCVQEGLLAAYPELQLPSIDLAVRRRGTRLEVRLTGGLTAPPCARAWLAPRAASVGEQPTRLTVPLR